MGWWQMTTNVTVGTIASRTLAGIRLVNGVLGLIAPQILIRRLGADPAVDGSAFYPFRLFGIRTIVLAVDLFTMRGAELRRASTAAVVIHSVDTVSAALGGIRGEMPAKASWITTAISGTNAVLAVVAWSFRPRGLIRPC
jgi:hypothetical protein